MVFGRLYVCMFVKMGCCYMTMDGTRSLCHWDCWIVFLLNFLFHFFFILFHINTCSSKRIMLWCVLVCCFFFFLLQNFHKIKIQSANEVYYYGFLFCILLPRDFVKSLLDGSPNSCNILITKRNLNTFYVRAIKTINHCWYMSYRMSDI